MNKVYCIVLDYSTNTAVSIDGMEMPDGWTTDDVERILSKHGFKYSNIMYMCSEEPIEVQHKTIK